MSTEATNGASTTEKVPAPDVEKKEDAPASEPEKQVGDKRDLGETAPAEENGTVTTEAPPEKKQKTGRGRKKAEAGIEKDAEATQPDGVSKVTEEANGTKKRGPGRPKKADAKKSQKTPTPRSGDGIGSRTRSRTKA
ncbi:hypothetical protein LOZ53_000681 [Ophidiomyces ophidiicola]|uniref:Uncharacterized protein n=1 Tax=Ophidiomyces ophidiicola TaxID=1387563 RepID=A0ACB8V5D5_9EURO|nr:uncharacterized protein LOZ57_003077 [Ophidiomyces ophidiicola]KAI1908911.1 hypothetical protein LOZ61_005324 [Ophidiomyces ophidiicola]KAI1923679.1 hypothetical protein LOZ64_000938 [Ophidiomyces ophidiicola]KAI1923899.1 hypothetical protein LOZ60_004970 [Ophidiomyces ophidiicola]KAI1947925.1 hypothetical protein LOZ57_003077 [Ophidiomyces ophidiicola]KAI1956069.1 hypothetical protein LOZ62_000061 [Ophidiomyces ophidiicola]